MLDGEKPPANMLLAFCCCCAGLLFGVSNAALQKSYLGDYLVIGNRVSALLQGKNKKGAMKLGTSAQIGPVMVVQGTHADGSPIQVSLQVRWGQSAWRLPFLSPNKD